MPLVLFLSLFSVNLQICSLFSLRLCCGSVAAVKHLTCSLCIKSLCFHCLCLPPSVLCKLDINMQSIKQLLHGPDFHLNWSTAVPSDQNAALSPDLWFHICLFTDGFTILTTRQFSRRPTSSSLMQDLNYHCKAPVISSSTLYTVTVQYKIAACFTPFFKILAPLRWDFSSYFETAGGF